MLVGLGASGAMLAGLYAADALTPGRIYDVLIEQASSELAAMPFPPVLLQATSGTDAVVVDVRRSPGAIGWHFSVGGEDIAVFRALLTPEGPAQTRVRVNFTPGEPLSPELGRLTSTKLTRDLAQIAMTEQVDALLEHRPIDNGETLRALARHAADHPEQVREYGLAVKQMMADIAQQAADTANAPERQPASSLNQSAMEAATRPSVKLPAN